MENKPLRLVDDKTTRETAGEVDLVKLQYDLYCIKNRSPLLDPKILHRTGWNIMSFRAHLSERSSRLSHNAGKRVCLSARRE